MIKIIKNSTWYKNTSFYSWIKLINERIAIEIDIEIVISIIFLGSWCRYSLLPPFRYQRYDKIPKKIEDLQ